MELIRSNPLECQVAELGRLSGAFTQHNIALKDLHIDLDPAKNNPFLLKRGYNLAELFLLTLVPCIGAGLAFLLLSTIDVKEIKETAIQPIRTEPKKHGPDCNGPGGGCRAAGRVSRCCLPTTWTISASRRLQKAT